MLPARTHPCGPDALEGEIHSEGELGRGRKCNDRLVVGYVEKPHLVSVYQVTAMRRAFGKLGVEERNLHPVPGMTGLSRVLKKAGLLRNLAKLPGEVFLVPILRLSEGDAFPVCYLHDVVTWSFDCWPDQYDQWVAFFERHRTRLAFISARASAEEIDRRCSDTTVLWLPEATDPEEYDPAKPLGDRAISVLELGRRFERYHSAIAPYLAAHGLTHVYEPVRGRKVFEGRSALARGLGDSRISICFPMTVTDSLLAGGLETATHRYFESIASGCVLVGKAPAELVELYGYNPVVEADLGDPVGQLQSILGDLGRFEGLVERNLKRLREVGTWDVRAQQILSALGEQRGLPLDGHAARR